MSNARRFAAAAVVLLAACADADDREPSDASVDTASAVSPLDDARSVPDSTSVGGSGVRDSLDALVRGPTAEERDAGAESWFSEETAGVIRSVEVDAAGRAVVDFADLREVIPNASSSAGSAMLLEELNEAMFRFPEIRSVEYRMEGSCDLFWEWLQYGCQIVERPGS